MKQPSNSVEEQQVPKQSIRNRLCISDEGVKVTTIEPDGTTKETLIKLSKFELNQLNANVYDSVNVYYKDKLDIVLGNHITLVAGKQVQYTHDYHAIVGNPIHFNPQELVDCKNLKKLPELSESVSGEDCSWLHHVTIDRVALLATILVVFYLVFFK